MKEPPLDPPDEEPLCGACDDTGLVVCLACAGTQQVPADCSCCLQPDGTRHGQCDECDNEPVQPCPDCGDGAAPCEDCPTCRHCYGVLRDGDHRRCWRIDHD